MAAGQDRDADHVDVLVVVRGGRDLVRAEPDPLVHHLKTGIPRRHSDLLRTVRVAVEAGLRHEQPRRSAPDRFDVLGGLAQLASTVAGATGDAGRAAVLADSSRRTSAHSPVVPPAWARVAGGHQVLADAATRRSSSTACFTAVASRLARHSTTSRRSSSSTAGSTTRTDDEALADT